MERLLALERVALLAQLSLEQLEAVAQLTQEAEYLPGELIVREGDPGDRLYLLLVHAGLAVSTASMLALALRLRRASQRGRTAEAATPN